MSESARGPWPAPPSLLPSPSPSIKVTGPRRGDVMIFKNLQYLAALAHEQHFARAAARCGVTQPTLSAGIKLLEEELGILVVQRGQRFQGFTPEGAQVLEWAHRILADCESLQQEVSLMKAGLTGRLRIGAIPVTLPIVSLLTGPFAQQFPQVTI